jgi:hypothetical protein
MSGIYLRDGDRYVAMRETPYDAEDVLQELIERHPEMLGGGEDSGHSLILVRREAGVSEQEDGGARWSLDHLYLDRHGIPTLVEVKRSSDTRSRREVVAQMLEYAAHARTSFTAERMADWLDEAARQHDTTGNEMLLGSFGVDDVEAFWQTVDTNLKAERLRLIFVADRIGTELRSIIEYLNRQMTSTEVLAIEVKQYTDAEGRHQTIDFWATPSKPARPSGSRCAVRHLTTTRSSLGSVITTSRLVRPRTPSLTGQNAHQSSMCATPPPSASSRSTAPQCSRSAPRQTRCVAHSRSTLKVSPNTARHGMRNTCSSW